jgi:hypothetical protein
MSSQITKMSKSKRENTMIATINKNELKKNGWRFEKYVFNCGYYNNVSVAKYVNEKGEIFITVDKAGRLLSDYRIDFKSHEGYVEFIENSTSEVHCIHNFRALRDLLIQMNYLN